MNKKKKNKKKKKQKKGRRKIKIANIINQWPTVVVC